MAAPSVINKAVGAHSEGRRSSMSLELFPLALSLPLVPTSFPLTYKVEGEPVRGEGGRGVSERPQHQQQRMH